MSLDIRELACGPGWRVADVVCTAGPADCPFEEQHKAVCISAVTQGMFGYRGTLGTALLAPGALLLGNPHHCFTCGHEHGTGDRCLSFHFTPQFMESVAAAVPGARRCDFSAPSVPPMPELLPLVAAAEAARDDADIHELEELALRLAGAVMATLAGTKRHGRAPRFRDERRIAVALQRIESQLGEHAGETLSLNDLASSAAMSPYHFLRIFRAVVGMTPHQYILHRRMCRAAVRLRRSKDNISAIAFDCGFSDLSTFNRRYRRIMGVSPSACRSARSMIPKSGNPVFGKDHAQRKSDL
jgi:AraC family transcriptional regulator